MEVEFNVEVANEICIGVDAILVEVDLND